MKHALVMCCAETRILHTVLCVVLKHVYFKHCVVCGDEARILHTVLHALVGPHLLVGTGLGNRQDMVVLDDTHCMVHPYKHTLHHFDVSPLYSRLQVRDMLGGTCLGNRQDVVIH